MKKVLVSALLLTVGSFAYAHNTGTASAPGTKETGANANTQASSPEHGAAHNDGSANKNSKETMHTAPAVERDQNTAGSDDSNANSRVARKTHKRGAHPNGSAY
jgi:hypothetical protein